MSSTTIAAIPSAEECDAIDGALQYVYGDLETFKSRLRDPDDGEQFGAATAEEAWRVLWFAKGIRSQTAQMDREAAALEEAAEEMYLRGLDAQVAAGGPSMNHAAAASYLAGLTEYAKDQAERV